MARWDAVNEGQCFCVVTPNYNMAEYLEQTIESVLANLRDGDEYYIVDGDSTDGSVDIIKKYESRISGWVSEPDKGYADALRKGFDMSSAPLMCWVNSGDLLLRGSLEEARQRLSCRQTEMVFGDALNIDNEGLITAFCNGFVPTLRKSMLYAGWTPWQVSCFWRRTLYDRVGGINKQLLAADHAFFLGCSMRGRVQYTPMTYGCHRLHSGQLSISRRDEYLRERDVTCNSYFNHGIYGVLIRIIWRCFAVLRARLWQPLTNNRGVIKRHVAEVVCSDMNPGWFKRND